MSKSAKLIIDGKTFELSVVVGTENEMGIDISKLRKDTSYIALDSGFANTGSCQSAITYLDGEKGVLRYRGIPIEQIAEHSTFVETSYLLIHGYLPNKDQLRNFSQSFTRHAILHPNMLSFFNKFPRRGHPMGLLSSMVCSLSGYYPELLNPEPTDEEMEMLAAELLAKVRTIAAYTFKTLHDEPFVEPRDDYDYISNFLHMLFSTPKRDYKIEPEIHDAMRVLFILHADHEQNCSTSTVRLVGSSLANLFASVSAGICALWGPLHGGANQKVVEMLRDISLSGGDIQKFIDKAKDPNDSYRLMGFGHRVYKNFDPRSQIIKQKAKNLFDKMGIKDPLLEIALKLEEAVLKDDYFKERKLYPNVDFYSGLIYKAIGIPIDMYTVMFAFARMPGWIAHWKEMRQDANTRIGRPRQIYTGQTKRDYIPLDKRS